MHSIIKINGSLKNCNTLTSLQIFNFFYSGTIPGLFFTLKNLEFDIFAFKHPNLNFLLI